jgi:probable phosphoglycerate mutase
MGELREHARPLWGDLLKDIFVVAHTESVHHVEGLVGGWYDTGLTELGREQARRTAGRLASLVAGREVGVFSSDLKRAAETAAIIGEALSVAPVLMPDLREMSYGSAGGMPEAWLRERQEFAPEDNRLDHRGGIDDAETKREFGTRIYRAMDEITARPCPVQVVVTHGFAVTFVVAAWVRMPLESTGYINLASNAGGITHLQEDDGRHNRAVRFLNAREHL